MSKIHSIKIKNFRGIADFEHVFGISDFICVIGRGDSGKTTILDAISFVLCGNWNLSFHDTDFFDGNIDTPILIEASLLDLPKRLLQEDKFGLYIRGLDVATNKIHDDLEDHHEKTITIRLTVESDLEPKWCVVNGRQEDKDIRAGDRASLKVFLVSDYIDRHFSWSVGSPLYSLLAEEKRENKRESVNAVVDALREVKNNIDEDSFTHLKPVVEKIKKNASTLGIDASNTSATIDFRDFSIKDGRISLHEGNIPFRLKGKGSKRLISIAIQLELIKKGGIILIDEIEQGLEPDRAQHLAKTLKTQNKGQIFITTHSRDVLVELEAENLYLMKKNERRLNLIGSSLQKVVRSNPEAFFSEKVLVCEGATEIGFFMGLNSFRIENEYDNASLKGVRFADGTGSSLIDYANGFRKAGYAVCLFCDSDDDAINDQKEVLIESGIKIIDCDDKNCIEYQVFFDLPWDGIKELVNYQFEISNGSIEASIRERYKIYGDLLPDWLNGEIPEIRKVLGETAKKKSWFKRIDHGKFLGQTCCKYLKQMADNRLRFQINEISNWIENA